jgi:hypothetical protein
MPKPMVGAGAGLPRLMYSHFGSDCHHLFSVGTDGGSPFSIDEARSVGVSIHLSVGTRFRFGCWFEFCIGIGIDLACLLWSFVRCFSGLLGPPY